jgi:hypothetical protein
MSRADSPSLAVTLAGVKMRAPVGIGAIGFPLIEPRHLTPEMHTEVLLKHVDAGAGFICLPLSAHVPDEMLADLEKKARPFDFSWEPAPAMFLKIDTPGFGAEGVYLFGSPGIPPKRLARRFKRETLKMIETLKQKKPKDVPIIANIAGLGAFPETFVTVAKACEEAGVELIELNLSCPMPVSLEEAPQIYSEKNFPLCFAEMGITIAPPILTSSLPVSLWCQSTW